MIKLIEIILEEQIIEVDENSYILRYWDVDSDKEVIDYVNKNNLKYIQHSTYQKNIHSYTYTLSRFKNFPFFKKEVKVFKAALIARIWHYDET